jgi:plasmid stabilization system protein ParE
MAKTIVWNSKSNSQFLKIVSYLEKEWGDDVAKGFINKTLRVLESLRSYPEMGQMENYKKQIRIFVITKQNTLYYRIDNNRIYLLNFFDNRQNPIKRSEI